MLKKRPVHYIIRHSCRIYLKDAHRHLLTGVGIAVEKILWQKAKKRLPLKTNDSLWKRAMCHQKHLSLCKNVLQSVAKYNIFGQTPSARDVQGLRIMGRYQACLLWPLFHPIIVIPNWAVYNYVNVSRTTWLSSIYTLKGKGSWNIL